MSKDELSNRETWQDYSGENAGFAERNFLTVMQHHFEGTNYQIRPKPREFKNIYSDVELPEDTVREIYNPPGGYKHGFIPDYAIDNIKTDKHLYVEVKRQDGWVEGKPMSAGRGNAHERSNKLFAPGLTAIMRKKGNLADNVLPFWIVFQGDITRDPKRNREVHFWFKGQERHFFMWRNTNDGTALIRHFNEKLKRLLE